MSKYKKTPKNLAEYLYYDSTSPSWLRWKVDRFTGKNLNMKNISKGDIAGSFHSTGYYFVSVNWEKFKAHRLVYKLHNPDFDETLDIDHLDGNSLNNSIENLRAVSHKVNGRNCKMSCNNSSGVTGVGISKKKGGKYYYTAELKIRGEKKLTKSFSVDKYGIMEAFKLACIARKDFVARAGDFTETHGDRRNNETK